MITFSVSTSNEAGLFVNALAFVAQEGSETVEEIGRIRTYFDEYYDKFGQSFIGQLQDRIRAGTLSSSTMNRVDSAFNWNVSGKPGELVPQVDDPSEAGLLINAMAWVAEASGFVQGEYDRMAEYFQEYNQKFGAPFRSDLRQRIDRGELSRHTMQTIAPDYSW